MATDRQLQLEDVHTPEVRVQVQIPVRRTALARLHRSTVRAVRVLGTHLHTADQAVLGLLEASLLLPGPVDSEVVASEVDHAVAAV